MVVSDEQVHVLDEESLEHFAEKGLQAAGILQAGIGNAAKVRRIMQVTRDLSPTPFADLRILDLACGEGVYTIEAGLRGAAVLAVDARTERMSQGMECARKNELVNVEFRQEDVRQVTKATHGTFDVIYFLGILYHLDVPDVFHVLEQLHEMCDDLLIIDTQISLTTRDTVSHDGAVYAGQKGREHADAASSQSRHEQLLMSIDNTFNFWFCEESLTRLLYDIGFSSVYKCLAPPEPGKPENRITLAARKGKVVKISTYPWINDLSEAEIESRIRGAAPPESAKRRLRSSVNRFLKAFGWELRRA